MVQAVAAISAYSPKPHSAMGSPSKLDQRLDCTMPQPDPSPQKAAPVPVSATPVR